MRPIVLTKNVENRIYEHAKSTYPDECCGFLFGTDDDERRITLALEVPNSKKGDKRRRFEISPQDYLRAEQYALRHNLTLLGIYHSHPDHPARPSQHDLRQAMPFFSYIIVAVQAGEIENITSWQLNEEGQFAGEPLYALRAHLNGKYLEHFIPIGLFRKNDLVAQEFVSQKI
jgi:proteasome lid subunit RPN8/RPN11